MQPKAEEIYHSIVKRTSSELPLVGKLFYVYERFYLRGDIKYATGIYLFGDNIKDSNTKFVPRHTQAVIRGLPNAVGIITKKDRWYNPESYFSDNEYDLFFDLFQFKINLALDKVKLLLQKEPFDHGIFIPYTGIGTGASLLHKKAPLIYSDIIGMMDRLKNL